MLSSVNESLNEVLNRNNEMMLRYLLGNTKISPIVTKYIKKTMEDYGDFLIDNPKQLT